MRFTTARLCGGEALMAISADILDIDLERPRNYHVKSTPAFAAYREHCTEIIREESSKLLVNAHAG